MMEDHNWIADHHTLFCVGAGILLGMEGFGAANYDFATAYSHTPK